MKNIEIAVAPAKQSGGKNYSETRTLWEEDAESANYVQQQFGAEIYDSEILATSNSLNIEFLSNTGFQNFINLKRVNDIGRINKFFETVNDNLEVGGKFIGFFESKDQRRQRIFRKFPKGVAHPFYVLDFIWKRVFPKVSGLKKVYRLLNKNHNTVLSTPEVLGRLIYSGFKIVDYQQGENRTYFCVEKVRQPYYHENPTYGPLISLRRKGFKGEWIKVYKFRTMHPYSEYLQNYIYIKNGTSDGDKIIDDFRITGWGKYLRKIWLDELPMVYNYLRGDLKIVGVRPLSKHKFNTYPKLLQKKRTRVKPGLIPPYYADLPDSVEEFHETERRYLDSYLEKPLRTDVRYFFKAFFNIIFNKARSK